LVIKIGLSNLNCELAENARIKFSAIRIVMFLKRFMGAKA
jgi:hypothetical protein